MMIRTTGCLFSDLYFHAVKPPFGKRESKVFFMESKGGRMKKANTLAPFLPWQSEFDHHYACWANNHRGWAKMKKSNKRLAKRREKRQLRKEMDHWKTWN